MRIDRLLALSALVSWFRRLHIPAGACPRAGQRPDPWAGMTRGKCVGLGANDFWLGTLAAFLLLAGFDRPTGAAQADDHALITQGEYLARAGDCIACHTDPGGALFAGGRPMATPFGTIYTSNFTPDPTTGIGSWTADQFYRTMHTNLSDADMRDLAAYYAYLPRPSDYPLIAGVRPRIVASGAPMRGIAPCGACHGDLDSKAGAGWLRGQPGSICAPNSRLSRPAPGTTTSASRCATSPAR